MYKRLFGFNFESIEKGRFSYDFYKISIDDGTRRLILIQLLTFNAFSFPLKWVLITASQFIIWFEWLIEILFSINIKFVFEFRNEFKPETR